MSIGSDAVDVAEEYMRTGVRTGQTSIEQISEVYGRQAVVVSIDPRRMYVADPSQVRPTQCMAQGPAEHLKERCKLSHARLCAVRLLHGCTHA